MACVISRISECMSGRIKNPILARFLAAGCISRPQYCMYFQYSCPCQTHTHTVLLLFRTSLGYGLNRCLPQTLKAADEMGGVCYPKFGDNKHAQSSLVSAPSLCPIQKSNQIFVIQLYALNLPTFVLHQGDFPRCPRQPVHSVSAAPEAPQ